MEFVLSVTNAPSAWRGTKSLESENAVIHTAIGLHPQVAAERKAELGLFEEVVATQRFVGEVGLDGQSNDSADRAAQVFVFDAVLAASARAGGRVISIHSRRAVTPVLDAIEKWPDAGQAVLHWFSGTRAELERAVRLGCWFSVGPAMTLGRRGQELLARMPVDRVLTETDGPFVCIGDRPAEQHDVRDALDTVSSLWSVSGLEAEHQVRLNLDALLTSIV